ncbi:MAG: Lacal_2735 family protein [Neptuniibacter sp.]
MFSIFKSDPAKKLNELYLAKLEQAMLAQRNGDIMGYSELTAEAEGIQRQIQALKSQKS